jgi:hypothetical protein
MIVVFVVYTGLNHGTHAHTQESAGTNLATEARTT